jgi:prepilin-type N-terminal cleavage/methylation domain-containing protein
MLAVRNRTFARSGLTLIEVAVAAAIFAVLAAVVFATVHGSVSTSTKRIGDAAMELRELTNALNKFDTATGNGSAPAGRMPRQLSHLTNPITTAQLNSCATVYSATNVSGWNNSPGPFYSRDVVPGAGFPLSIGLVRDTLVRTPATAPNVTRSWGTLQVRIDNVSFADAQELNALVDGDNSATIGTIQWTAVPNAEGMLSSIFWTIPVGGC